ncbi:NUDIX hydrolase [Pengzhenrongella sicca]|uniref:NUDIX hydrolase n=1 Tax=Pengzhenrongella sicca TaxID=2819238 RepID=UPI001D0C105D|nr:NUDIX domain-containing protein [Pengzhenrongella sicca]
MVQSPDAQNPDVPTPDVPTPAREILATLQAWTPVAPAQVVLKSEYETFLRLADASALDRHAGPEHLTGSCFVLTPDLSRVLLCLHRKGQFWVQLGGHVEPGDASVAAAAHREAREESGLVDLRPFDGTPIDVDRHALGDRFGACRVHWDVGFVAFADPGAAPAASDESEAVAWFDVDRLPPRLPPGFAARLRTVLAELADRSGRP